MGGARNMREVRERRVKSFSQNFWRKGQ